MRARVAIPCLDESLTIGSVVDDVTSACACFADCGVVVYDNGSSDDTMRVAHEHGAEVRCVASRGKGLVMRRALADAAEDGIDVIVFIDGDDTYDASVIPALVACVASGADMAVGDRRAFSSFADAQSWSHAFGNRLVSWLVNGIFGGYHTDVMSGLRALSVGSAGRLPLKSRGFTVETELECLASAAHLMLDAVPVRYYDRPAGSHSKLRTVPDGMAVLATICRLSFIFEPAPIDVAASALFAIFGGFVWFLVALSVAVLSSVWSACARDLLRDVCDGGGSR